MNRRLLILCLFVSVATLAACNQTINLLDESKLNDRSLLTGEPCEAPCWNGITPGETSYRDAKLIIESDSRLRIAEEPEPEEGQLGRAFTFQEGENPACCQVISRDGETIDSFLLQLAPNMSYGPVFDKFGEPTYALGQPVNDEQAYALLVHPDVPLIVYVFIEGGSQGQISVNSPVIGAMYISEANMQETLVCARLNNWNGFQAFSAYAEGENFDYVGSGVGDENQCPTS